MRPSGKQGILLIFLLWSGLLLIGISTAWAYPVAQIPTGSVPTVTGTPPGVIATVKKGEQTR